VCKVIHPMLKSSDPFHHVLSLVNPTTDVSLQRSVPIKVPSRGSGPRLEARLWVTVRGVVTATLMVNRVATPYPVSHWGPKDEPAVLSWSAVLPRYKLAHECEVVL
jgi:hypothetical protein